MANSGNCLRTRQAHDTNRFIPRTWHIDYEREDIYTLEDGEPSHGAR
jgi:hypothetical protein